MNLTNLESINLLQEQVAATLVDPCNMPDLNCIPSDQHDQVWALLRGMVIVVIDEEGPEGFSVIYPSPYLNGEERGT